MPHLTGTKVGLCGSENHTLAPLHVLAGFLFVLIVAGCETAEMRTDRLARFVDEISFGGPIDQHLIRNNALVRWSSDIRVTVLGIQAADYQHRVMSQLSAFTRATGIPAILAPQNEAPNVTVTFVKSPDFLINRERVPCYAELYGDDHLITHAEVQVSIANPEQIDICLAHEFMHVFGLRYHSGIVRSVLSPAHEETGLTPWDELALKVLYDPRLEPGSTRDAATAIVRDILSENLLKL